jgi:hypothetical protein
VEFKLLKAYLSVARPDDTRQMLSGRRQLGADRGHSLDVDRPAQVDPQRPLDMPLTCWRQSNQPTEKQKIATSIVHQLRLTSRLMRDGLCRRKFSVAVRMAY